MKTGLLIGALVLGAAVSAASAHPRGAGNFEALDADADGFVTVQELESARADRFAEADTDGDGALSAEELIARAAADRADRMIERLDENGDGVLQQAELPDRGTDRMFERADADGDGMLSAAEFEEARERGRPGHGPGRGDRD